MRLISSVVLVAVLGLCGAIGGPASAETKPLPGFGVQCNDYTTVPGVSESCEVYVYDTGHGQPTGTVTLSVPSYKGHLSQTSCQMTLSNNSCSFLYTPTGTGSTTRKDPITATYPGNATYASSKSTVSISVRPAPVAGFGLSCNTYTTTPGVSVPCQTYVYDTGYGQPVGTISLIVTNSRGYTSSSSCQLTPLNTYCWFTYTPFGAGSSYRKDTVTASYSGDSRYAPAKTSIKISVTPQPVPGYGMSCSTSTTTPGTPVPCTATVYNSGLGTPSGPLTITVPSYKGTVTPTTCSNVAAGPCHFTYTAKGAGSAYRKDTITATYPGDYRYAKVKMTTVINVD